MGSSTRVLLALVSLTTSASAQGLGASTREPDQPSRRALLGPSPGSGANPLGGNPGAGDAVLESRFGSSGPRIVPENPGASARAREPDAGIANPARARANTASPFIPLALPGDDDEGPRDGLTLDAAIERLIRTNLDLRAKSLELPQAEADILTAGLRANPLLYSDVQCVPYGNFSTRRPGGQTQYDLNVSYPLDLSRKRKARVLVACRARRVLEAQYQDAVRVEIDNLSTRFVDVLAARETLREAREVVRELQQEAKETELPPGRRTPASDKTLEIDREVAELGLAEAEEQLKTELRELGALLGFSPDQAERLEIRGSLHDPAPPPADPAALAALALAGRPDLVAYRLGVGRAEADVKLALANRYPDIYMLYQPYTFQNDAPLDRKSAHSWGVGVSVPLPLFNRNQGNIARAQSNVTQTRIELAALEEKVLMEVRQAERSYTVSRSAIARMELSLLPLAKEEHDRAVRQYAAGREPESAFLAAERAYDRVVRQYRDSLVKHRRAMLKLNFAVGQRILP